MRLAIVVVIALGLASCGLMGPTYHPLSPAELEQRGTRAYAALSIEQSVTAASTALQVLGYQLVVADVATRTIKTAPHKIMLRDATEAEQMSTRDEIVWWLRFDPGPNDGVTIHAILRGFHNGEEVGPDRIVAEVVDPHFAALWREIDGEVSRLRGPGGPGEPAGQGAGAAPGAAPSGQPQF